MRLICPNCDAQYEVDAALVPPPGRDVQCSDCGHVWFQDAEDTGAPPFEDVLPGPEPEPQPEPEPEPEPAPRAATEPAPPPPSPTPRAEPPAPDDDDDDEPGVTPLAQRSLDDSLLAVLKEEAEREARARQAERTTLVETQPELGLEAAPRRRVAVRPRPEPAAPDPDPVEPDPEPDVPAPRSARKERLPDIEQINSTLSPSGVKRAQPEGSAAEMRLPATPQRRRRAFRTSFLLVLVIAVVLATVYAQAPMIAEILPQAKAPLDSYVAQVDGLRLQLDTWLSGLLDRIKTEGGA